MDRLQNKPSIYCVSRSRMTITQRLSLLWRRFSPLEERLIAAVRDVLPPQVQLNFDAQVAAITLVQRHPHWTEIAFYRRRNGKVDWSGVPMFPRIGELRLAEVRFTAKGRRYKATLTSIAGHIFDFAITPSPKAIAFADWESAPSVRLLTDPLTVESSRETEPIPDAWREFLARRQPQDTDGWAYHGSETAYRTTFDDSEFLVLAERQGDEFVLHRIEPPASTLFYMESHDGTPEPIKGDIDDVFRETNTRNT
jgi:hypothetical protein